MLVTPLKMPAMFLQMSSLKTIVTLTVVLDLQTDLFA